MAFFVSCKSDEYRLQGKVFTTVQQMIAKGEVVLPDNTHRKELFNLLYQKDWVVYAKALFNGPCAVIEYQENPICRNQIPRSGKSIF